MKMGMCICVVWYSYVACSRSARAWPKVWLRHCITLQCLTAFTMQYQHHTTFVILYANINRLTTDGFCTYSVTGETGCWGLFFLTPVATASKVFVLILTKKHKDLSD